MIEFGNIHQCSMLHHLKYKTTKDASGIRPAPHRFILDVFGGDVGIDEFRSNANTLSSHACMGAVKLNSAQFIRIKQV